MPIVHLPADAPLEKIFEAIARDGCVVIDEVIDHSAIEEVRRDMDPFLEAAPEGGDDFAGLATRWSGMLVARSPKARDVIMNPTVLDVAAHTLSHASTFQLHVTQIISVGPGATPQPIHRDQWAFDFFPFPSGYESTLSTMWALSDFTEANGATRIIPGSHKMKDRLEFTLADTEPAEMKAGSVLLYMGSVYHGAGANQTDSDRLGLVVHYTLGWLRQEENQYLGASADILRTLPEDLLRLMGYTQGANSLGLIDCGRDPIAAVRPEFERALEVYDDTFRCVESEGSCSEGKVFPNSGKTILGV
jgi:hypothetical protein